MSILLTFTKNSVITQVKKNRNLTQTSNIAVIRYQQVA